MPHPRNCRPEPERHARGRLRPRRIRGTGRGCQRLLRREQQKAPDRSRRPELGWGVGLLVLCQGCGHLCLDRRDLRLIHHKELAQAQNVQLRERVWHPIGVRLPRRGRCPPPRGDVSTLRRIDPQQLGRWPWSAVAVVEHPSCLSWRRRAATRCNAGSGPNHPVTCDSPRGAAAAQDRD